jgi:hypothetical protein
LETKIRTFALQGEHIGALLFSSLKVHTPVMRCRPARMTV